MARILYSDDDNFATGMFQEILGEGGHQVVTVNSPEAAFAVLKDCSEYDLYVTDFDYGFFSKLNGIDAAVGARDLVPDLRIILFSGLDRTKELAERGVDVEQMGKEDLAALFELINAL
jgi:CheY-like chemotaxis protein